MSERAAVMKRLKWLIWATNRTAAQVNEYVQHYSKGAATKVHEMNDYSLSALYGYLESLNNSLNAQRRRIFSKVRSINNIPSEESITEADVMSYLERVVGLHIAEGQRLNSFDSEALHLINTKLDAIEKKTIAKRRKEMRPLK